MSQSVVLYARVSTLNQSTGLQAQVRALEQYANSNGIQGYILITDEVSGRKSSRPGLDKLNEAVKRGEVSKVVVYSLSRYSRSVKHLLESLDLLAQRNVGFVSLTEALDTSTPTGRAVITIISAIAQLEADLIRERVKTGLMNAKAKGIKLGRPKSITNNELIAHLAKQNLSQREIAKFAKCSVASVCRALKSVSKASA